MQNVLSSIINPFKLIEDNRKLKDQLKKIQYFYLRFVWDSV